MYIIYIVWIVFTILTYIGNPYGICKFYMLHCRHNLDGLYNLYNITQYAKSEGYVIYLYIV